jgi:uncharacterized protein (DUF4415 family)
MSKRTTVKRTLDLTKPPVVTAAQKARLAALAAMPDDQIDTSDIPSSPSADWIKAVEMPHTEPKQQITLRIDADVLDFFRNTGSLYQTRINAVLRSYAEAHRGNPKRATGNR